MGFLFLILYPGSLPSRRLLLPPPLVLPHTIFVTYNFAHHLSHTALSHTFDTQLCHTPSFTYNNFTHTQLCHTSSVTNHVAHTIFHTQLCHTPSTHNFVTHHFVTHQISHNFVTHQLSTQLCHTPLCHTPTFTHNFVTHQHSHTTLSHTIFQHNFVTHQAWHNLTSTFVLHGRRGTHGTGWRAWARLVARDAAALCVAGAAALCVAGVALDLGFTWQAWRMRGRRGTHGPGYIDNRYGHG